MTILALDDEQSALKVLVRAIHAAEPDAQVFPFTDPDEAIAFAAEHHLNAAFLDIRLCGVSGLCVGRHMQDRQPDLNLIFTTGYDEYAVNAFHLHSSGYLLKPISTADVAAELASLRFPPQPHPKSRLYIRTFGHFDLFVDGIPYNFRREPAKEMLAYLVDVRGSQVTRKELAAILFEDREYNRTSQSYLTQIVKSLRDALHEIEADDLLTSNYNSYSVNTSMFTCDAYDYLDTPPEKRTGYNGDYMQQYSWADVSRGKFR